MLCVYIRKSTPHSKGFKGDELCIYRKQAISCPDCSFFSQRPSIKTEPGIVETDMQPQCVESNVSRISDVIDARVNQNFLVVIGKKIGKKDTIWLLSSYMFVSCYRAETPTSLRVSSCTTTSSCGWRQSYWAESSGGRRGGTSCRHL